MSDSVMLWSVVAMLLFWAMGAYNRLMRLRSQGIAAFAALEQLFDQYLLMLKRDAPGQGSDASSAAWAALAAAADQFRASLRVAHSQPLNGPTTSALRTAYETLCLSWSRVQALPPDPDGAALPDSLQSQFEQLAHQADMARADFNRAVANYNAAIGQFPALVLASLFGFRPAQPI